MKESVIKHITHKLQNLKISKIPREKKYLISQETRNYIKSKDTEYIGILPIKSTSLPVYNPKKEFFLHQTDILTHQNQMICIPVLKSNISKPKLVQEFILKNLGISITLKKISKILDVENSKIQLFIVNLTEFQIIDDTNSSNTLVDKLEKLSLNNSILISKLKEKDYTFQKILDFYNQIEVRKSIRELYQNIGTIPQNNYRLKKCVVMTLPSTNFTVNFKYGLIYSRLG